MTLAGAALAVGSKAPAFELHYADAGIKKLTLEDLRNHALAVGEPSLISGKQELFENMLNRYI
jgi:hypothetical protein